MTWNFLCYWGWRSVCVWRREARTQTEPRLCQCSCHVVDGFVKIGVICFLETNTIWKSVLPGTWERWGAHVRDHTWSWQRVCFEQRCGLCITPCSYPCGWCVGRTTSAIVMISLRVWKYLCMGVCVCVCVLILQFEPLVFNSNNGTSSLPLTDGDISPWKWNHLLRVPQLISCWDVAPLEPTVLPDDDCGVCSIETYCVKGLKKPYLFYFNLWISVILKSLFRKHGIYLSTATVFNI